MFQTSHDVTNLVQYVFNSISWILPSPIPKFRAFFHYFPINSTAEDSAISKPDQKTPEVSHRIEKHNEGENERRSMEYDRRSFNYPNGE